MKTELILNYDKFWRTNMESKLELFYKKCILPELVSRTKKGICPYGSAEIPLKNLRM